MALIAAFLPMLPAFIPVLGLWPLYRMRLLRAMLMITAWSLESAAWVIPPASLVALPFVLLFTSPAAFLEPQRIFIPLIDPKHVPAPRAKIRDEDLVLGYEEGKDAVAWPFETLVPRHLINDRLSTEPLLAAY